MNHWPTVLAWSVPEKLISVSLVSCRAKQLCIARWIEVVNNCGREHEQLAADDLPRLDHVAQKHPKDYRSNRITIAKESSTLSYSFDAISFRRNSFAFAGNSPLLVATATASVRQIAFSFFSIELA